mgnify:CR=1 FL=1
MLQVGSKFSSLSHQLSLDDSVEGGQSLTIGGEYSLKSKENDNDIVVAGLATVLRDKEEINLPNKSTLNNKGSDLIGSLVFAPNQNFKIDYNFSMDNDFESTNYNLLKTDIKVNKFVTSFEFLQEDDEVGSESYLSNETSFNFNSARLAKVRGNVSKNLPPIANKIAKIISPIIIKNLSVFDIFLDEILVTNFSKK